MNHHKKIKKLAKELINPVPMLAGTVNEQRITCGNSNCRCMDKKNPQKHTCNKLSYSQGGRTKAITLKKADVTTAIEMTESYRKLRQAVLEIGQESALLVREHGAQKAKEMIAGIFEKSIAELLGRKPEPAVLKDTKVSRDKWKAKAKERHGDIAKNNVTIRDLKASRDNWKEKAIASRQENVSLKQQLIESEKKRLNLEKQIDNKKNSRKRG